MLAPGVVTEAMWGQFCSGQREITAALREQNMHLLTMFRWKGNFWSDTFSLPPEVPARYELDHIEELLKLLFDGAALERGRRTWEKYIMVGDPRLAPTGLASLRLAGLDGLIGEATHLGLEMFCWLRQHNAAEEYACLKLPPGASAYTDIHNGYLHLQGRMWRVIA
jgi:hypothetical protein